MSNPVLTAWNDVLQDQVRSNKIDPNTACRYGALLHTAQWQALQDSTAQGATPEVQAAAVASAGKTVILSILPNAADKVNALYEQQAPAAAPAAAPIDRSATLTTALLNDRANDGSSFAPPPYKGVEEVGKWRSTPPDFKAGLTPHWGQVKPFNLEKGDQFRVPAPPALDSLAFKMSYLEVKQVGSKNSTSRSVDQTQTVHFWSAPNIEMMWYQVLNQVAANLSLADSARAYAATASAMADARIAAFDSKYFYNLWRPITSIPVGNNVTDFPADPAFQTELMMTPPHPEYPQGHTTTGEAAATVLRAIAGTDDVPFVLTSEKVPGMTRTYLSFSAASHENKESRMLGGVHFRFSGDRSLPLGQKVGEAAVAAYSYKPVAAPGLPATKGKSTRRNVLRRE
jgi:hypothetical protein